jgi:hypothetical protein
MADKATINLESMVERMARYPAVVRAAAMLVSAEDARWKPTAKDWSILEVCCHLLDEEREDFRLRLRSTLEDASRPWAPLDLTGVAEARGYNTRDLGETLAAFERERADSMAWLRGLEGAGKRVDWSIAYQHPKVGPVRAGELMVSWAAHDALHLRQISRRVYQMALRDAPGQSAVYAGEW